MKDYSVLEKIRKSADSCEIPESLKPENLDLEKKGNLRNIYSRGPWKKAAAAAAVLALAVLAGFLTVNFKGNQGEQLSASFETAKKMEETAGSAGKEEGAQTLEELYIPAEDYDEICKKLQNSLSNARSENLLESETAMGDMAAAEEAAASEAADSGSTVSYAGDYSQTNVQTEGVDEGDVVKTDGRYLYIIREGREVQIVSIQAGKMAEVAVIRPTLEQSENSILDMYLTGDTLQIICQRYDADMQEDGEDAYYMNYRGITSVCTYDLTDRANPVHVGTTEQEGTYYTSRKSGEYLYLFTSVYPQESLIRQYADQGKEYGLIPLVNGEAMAASDIYIPRDDDKSGTEYMLITSVNENKPDQIADQKAILESASRFYVSTENIYLERENWEAGSTQTAIARFSFSQGKIKGESAGVVNGAVTDDFATNEYDGFLRVLTTQWNDSGSQTNNVYVLDQNMEIVGKIDNLAEDESIYSARFMGNTGYFVTYRQVDPLFSVDFSDPTHPKILGELKVSGFSEYLHFYGENRLLGIGWETDPETGATKGLKLSMFDVSDPADVKEVDKLVIKNIDYFPGEYNYKALTVSPEKNVIGLAASSYESSGTVNSYMVFSYDEKEGFLTDLTYGLQEGGDVSAEEVRGVYADDTFYVADGNNVTAFNMGKGYEKIAELAG
ncbi:MAG TPA: beta-propeller domain-containing protein [Candidatus Ruminococcus avistercoris]|nr:beta-propeller domain-containing protein [Candidatus Ruminococcus avistercoris]